MFCFKQLLRHDFHRLWISNATVYASRIIAFMVLVLRCSSARSAFFFGKAAPLPLIEQELVRWQYRRCHGGSCCCFKRSQRSFSILCPSLWIPDVLSCSMLWFRSAISSLKRSSAPPQQRCCRPRFTPGSRAIQFSSRRTAPADQTSSFWISIAVGKGITI